MNPKHILATQGLYKHTHYQYRKTFQTEEGYGEQVVLDLTKRFFGLQTTFDLNPQQQAFNEGQRSVVLHILGMLGKNASDFPEITRKAIEHGSRN